MVRPALFVSYKRDHTATEAAFEQVQALLQGRELDIWRDTEIEGGDRWSAQLYTRLLECSGAIVLVSEEAAKSEWCRREWWVLQERSLLEGIPVIPISVDGSTATGGVWDSTQLIKLSELEERAGELEKLDKARPSVTAYLAAHHAWLRSQFSVQKCWDIEPFTLKNVYVETECGRLTWGEIAKGKDPFVEENGGRQDLVETVLDLMADKKLLEPIVVQGPPGAGKSAFTLRLATKLRELEFEPVLARFRDFRIGHLNSVDEIINDAVRVGPRDEQPPKPQTSLLSEDQLNRTREFRGICMARIVVILDGWDEVALSGNVSYQAQLDRLLPMIRQAFSDRPGPPVRLILTGRPSAQISGNQIMRRETPVLTLRPMKPGALVGYATAIANKLGDKAAWKLDMERLQPVFEAYRSGAEGMDVMGSPLLAFLAFRTIDKYKGDAAELVANPTHLYQELVKVTVAHGGKGMEDLEVQSAVHQGGEGLRKFLHWVASVMSVLGQEAVSHDELELRLQADPELSADFGDRFGDRSLKQYTQDETQRTVLLELMVSFFFKGGNRALGCEFLHKSFREYLFAECIFTKLIECVPDETVGVPEPTGEFWRDFPEGSIQYKASRDLAPLLAPQFLTFEVRDHLVWLMRQDMEAHPGRWQALRDLLLDLYIWWAEGAHTRLQPGKRGDWEAAYQDQLLRDYLPRDQRDRRSSPRSAVLDGHLGESLMQMTAVVHSGIKAELAQQDREGGLRARYRKQGDWPRFHPAGEDFFVELVARVNAAGGWMGSAFPSRGLLPDVSLSDSNLRLTSFVRTDLVGAALRGADLRDADLSRADLRDAKLMDADLRGADLSRADLRDAKLMDAKLMDADLRDAALSGADLIGANLSGADLRAAKTHEARFPPNWEKKVAHKPDDPFDP